MVVMTKSASFTGRTRHRKTRRSVLVADRFSRFLITIGGIATILAVLGVGLYLVLVALPLFLGAEIGDPERAVLVDGSSRDPLYLGVDEYQHLGWVLLPSGKAEVFRLADGAQVETIDLYPDGELLSASLPLQGSRAVLGLRRGAVATAKVEFVTRVADPHSFPPKLVRELEALPEGGVVAWDHGVVERTPAGQFRHQRLHLQVENEIEIGAGEVRLVDLVEPSTGPLIVLLTAEEGRFRLWSVTGEEKSNFLTGAKKLVFGEPVELPFEPLAPGPPSFLAVTGSGSDVMVGWKSGELFRVTMDRPTEAFIAEKGRLTPEGVGLRAFRGILGSTTFLWADAAGGLHGGFLLRVDDYEGPSIEGMELQGKATTRFVLTKTLAERGAPAVVSLAPSARTRLVLAGTDDSRLRLYNVTNEAELADFRLDPGEEIVRAVLTPKQDGIVVLTRPSGGHGGDPARLRRGGELAVYHASLDPGYPEASVEGLFEKVWYEGYSEPKHIWQSSSATDDFEPKLGLYPLIFGTIKATFYSMLFGAPLALLAAIFTSEFLSPRTRTVIKPSIELMASLPSVVLGFLAALVFAPFVESYLTPVLGLFVAMPVVFVGGAYVWQLLPSTVALRLERFRFAFLCAALPVGFALAWVVGPLFEALFFEGDLKGWLAWEGQGGRFADATGGWLFLFLPLSAFAVAWLSGRHATPWLARRGWDRRRLALADAARFLLGAAAALLLAWLVSAVLAGMGFDPRGNYLDTYVQRNALIVGFVMGFAVIPIIYTISDDALSTVPEHLRSASLGAGATPWQTATRIIIPTAMSGLFSAVMVGLGRAVGETMIVLMAAGNTPVLEWNVFEGFRTLSANIAVELPEAVRGSTHYRTLFLAALVLFAMTFVVNTVAEIVRLRFRKRAYQL